MSDDKDISEEEEEEEEGGETGKEEAPAKAEISEAELAMEKMRKKKEEEEAMWAEYIEQRKKQRAKEEEELRKLKERQIKRKERRKEEEKKLLALKKQQEAQRIKEIEEKKAKEAEAKQKRLEEAERKRQAMQEALQRKIQEPITPNFVINKKNEDGTVTSALEKFPSALYIRAEMAKTKEQLAEDKKIALTVRVKDLQLESLTIAELRQKAQGLWEAIVRLESEKYDLEERRKRQEYDLKELSERQRQINRSKALKKGLDPEALSGKYPPMINVASKYERRLDRRSFTDKKSLFEGGYVSQLEAMTSSEWENRVKNFKERGPSKLPKWDPTSAKTKEKPQPREPIEDEDIEDDDYLGPSTEVPTNEKPEQNEEEEEEEEEEGEEEEEEE